MVILAATGQANRLADYCCKVSSCQVVFISQDTVHCDACPTEHEVASW